jgi:cytochrome c553
MRAHLALLALAACQAASSAPLPSPRPTPPPADFEHDMMVRYHMHGSLDLLRAIDRLLLHNHLDEARALARSIAEAPAAPDLGAWATQAQAVRERAAALASAPSIDEACRREARLGEACATCHVATHVQPEFHTPPALPPDLDTIPARMARHRWAADRLWEGLVGGDDAPWQAGLEVLAAAPLRWPELGERKGLARLLQRLAEQARQRGATAGPAERATTYGEMAVTCAACHAAK